MMLSCLLSPGGVLASQLLKAMAAEILESLGLAGYLSNPRELG